MLLGQFQLFTPDEAPAVIENPGDAECQIEHTGRLLLPDYLLQRLAACQPPFLFRLTAGGNSVHLGYPVFRTFSGADVDNQQGIGRNCVLVPTWAATQLLGSNTCSVAPGRDKAVASATTSSSSDSKTAVSRAAPARAAMVSVSMETLPTGSFIRLRPLQPDDVSSWANPAATLNKKLRDFACLSVGSVFTIQYLDRVFHFEIMSLKPANAVSVIDCDMQLEFDFDPPGESGCGATGTAADGAAVASGKVEDIVLSAEHLSRCGITATGSAALPNSTASSAAAPSSDVILRDALSRARRATDASARRWGSGVSLTTGQEVTACAATPAAPAETRITPEASTIEPNLSYEWGTLDFTHPAGRFQVPRVSVPPSAESSAAGRGIRLKDNL